MKLKNCDRCHKLVSIRYRIQCDQTNHWCKVCPDCWQMVARNNPHYRYGGTWKAKSK